MSRTIQRRAKLEEEQIPDWDEHYDIEEFINIQDNLMEGLFDNMTETGEGND